MVLLKLKTDNSKYIDKKHNYTIVKYMVLKSIDLKFKIIAQ